ncbi:TIGR01777 family oxidoreductase [Alloalcanivorax profundimaris]|uniref:TIGR01777 family oxidoreductase n=1 Tax=Alloalcanivorax profundimaris TaxID=2735259 RepID=UPI00136F342B|nr:TIGR01777 family oxidoreductase [Alloalcanivorax profundimaris]MBF1801565.1 TIGR01777 family protein [Alloalcanivorax profundimaris]MBM1145033.1 TIGR01777 family oxidoreductase [Alcanivorax sp. ZXX171]MCQ6261549.1 TIGR01777 family oxidoreductase [Alcanivorax sp. MM125-6]
MNVLITGGSGFIGRALCARLAAGGHRLIVLSRRPAKARPLLPADTRVVASLDEIDDDEALDGIVNLAGENLFSGRWTAPRKDRLLASRVETTAAVIALARRLRRTPEVLVSGSAVGFYGDAGDAELTEHSSARRKDFGYRLCDAWEQRARDALSLGMRLCVIRTGIVLGRDGGMLAKLWPVYRLGLGARLGKGSQWLSWIHIEDMVTILERALETPGVDGVFNATAPNPVTQRGFHRALAAAAHRPAPWVAPAPLLKLMLGELSDMLLGGQRVYPRRLEDQGFVFRFPRLEDALADLAG